MNVPGEPLLSHVLLASSLLPPWRDATRSLPHADVRFFRLGRDALAQAVSTLAPGPVLVPAFICRDAVEGLKAAGREVRFYSLGPDMNPDWTTVGVALAGAVREAEPEPGPFDPSRTSGLRANSLIAQPATLVLVHYFGVAADVSAARSWCDERGVALIEDCAHSFLSTVGGRPLGSSGDFAVFSFRKQLPVASGAALVINSGATRAGRSQGSSAPLTPAPARGSGQRLSRRERGMWRGFSQRERKIENRPENGPQSLPVRGPSAGLVSALREVSAWAVFASGSGRLRRWLAPSLSDERELRAAAPGRAPGTDCVTRRVIARLSKKFDEIAERRRSNYLLLQRELGVSGGLTPVFASLPEGAVPWGFPLLVKGGRERRDELLSALLAEGIGAWVWPVLPAEVADRDFPEEWRLASETIVLPVHQGLSARHIQHLADTVSAWTVSQTVEPTRPRA